MVWITNGGITQDVPEFRAELLTEKDGSWKRVGKAAAAVAADAEPVVEPEPVVRAGQRKPQPGIVVEPEPVVGTNAEIRADAEAAGIDLGDATAKADMLAAIDAHYTK